jgi:hypothetical protein
MTTYLNSMPRKHVPIFGSFKLRRDVEDDGDIYEMVYIAQGK